MADDDDYAPKAELVDPYPQGGTTPTPQQEQDVNKQLFGGKAPGPDVQRAQPVTPEDTANYALTSAQRRYEEAKARDDAHEAQLQSRYEEMQATIARNQRAIQQAEQNRPELQQVQTVQPTPTQQQNIGNILGNVAALVAIGTAVFGKHRGGWGTAITQAGVGAFLKNFAESRQEQSKETFDQWKESQRLIQYNNQAKINDYKEILADRRLDLSEQHQQLAELAYERNDQRMYSAATRNAHAEVVKIMEQQQKAADAAKVSAQKAQDKINETLIKKQEAEQAAGKKVVSIPTFRTVADAMKYPIGTEFYDGKGVHYKITKTGKTAEDFEVQPIKDE